MPASSRVFPVITEHVFGADAGAADLTTKQRVARVLLNSAQ